MKSLYKDKSDRAGLHSPSWRAEIKQAPKMEMQWVPFFYNSAGASLSIEGTYRGASAFLMAGGPSVLELDLAPLFDRWVMTLNNSPKTFRGNANCIVDDPSRFSLSTWLDPAIQKFTPTFSF